MAFYVQVDAQRFESTELTRGPWDAGAQHGGPPSALAGHIVETRTGARPDLRVTRMTVELMRPVPIAPLNVATRTVHSGRSVEVVEVTLTPDAGKPVLRATAQLIRVAESDDEPVDEPRAELPAPDTIAPHQWEFPFEVGYHTALDTRAVRGSFRAIGPAAYWTRLRVPVVDGVPASPLGRVLTAADSGNGISNVLDIDKYLFVNPDLTVVLHRYPVGEWVALDARTTLGGNGIGVAASTLHDERGPIGNGLQSLFIAPR